MKLQDLIDKVALEWRSAFVRFVETGDADPSFLDHLDVDPTMQEAVELAFSAQSDKLEKLAHTLRAAGPLPMRVESSVGARRPAPTGEVLRDAVTAAIKNAVRLPSPQRRVVMRDAIASLGRDDDGPGERDELRKALSDLKRAVDSAAERIER